jgi:isopropylmalate/homocitrate/citramalate synthase
LDKHELYDIWEVEELVEYPWRCQLVNYVGQFATKTAAETYAAAVKKEREQQKTTQYMEAAEMPRKKAVK